MCAEGEVADFEGLELINPPQTRRLEHRAGGGALNRKGGYLLGDLADLDVETDGRIEQPIELAFRRANPILAFAHAKNRAVVDEMTRIVAPYTVGDTIRLELGDVAGDQAIEVGQRVRTRDAVLHHRCKDIDRRVARPRYETVELAQSAGALVKRSLEQRLLEVRREGFSHGEFELILSTCCAALRPATPMTPPPG